MQEAERLLYDLEQAIATQKEVADITNDATLYVDTLPTTTNLFDDSDKVVFSF
jgi:hypothetical protein